TTTYGWNGTQQATRSVSEGSITRSVQSMSYGLAGQLERVVTTTSNGSGTVTGRTRVDYRYTPQGIRTISVDWNDANLDGTFAAGERTGSIEYLIDNANFTGYQQTILETVKNAAGQATKRTSYTFGVDEITQTTTLPLPGGGEGWGEGETLTFAHDGKGSVRALFGAAAAIAQVFTYSAYGELLAIHNGSGTLQPLTSSLTSVLYNGEGLDARTGLYNMRARWYSASNARWERLDPFAGNPNDPFSFNKYGFVHGDPVQGIDPTGYEFSLSGMSTAISIGLGKVAGVVSLIGSVFTAVNTVLTVFDVIQSLYDIASNGNLSQTIKKEVTEYFTQLRANANDPEIGVLFNGDFWKGSAESFSRNLDELSRQLLASRTITSDLLNALRKIRDSKYPRIVIQLPVPPTLPVPKALVPLPIKVRLGPIQVGVTLQFGASKKHKGRVLGIAVQTADNESAITQVFRQDYHEWHVQSGPSEDTRWNDNTGKFKFHYHVPK
ncbi:MAG: RHS repeat-associated core domain-containing protein, partial [Planctomycetota bacterium]